MMGICSKFRRAGWPPGLAVLPVCRRDCGPGDNGRRGHPTG